MKDETNEEQVTGFEELEALLRRHEAEHEQHKQEWERQKNSTSADFYSMLEQQREEFFRVTAKIGDAAVRAAPPTAGGAGPAKGVPFDPRVDMDEYEKFDRHPYFMYPADRKTLYVMVPKFYPQFRVGWLKDEVDGVWYRYEVNQYSILFGHVPEEILKRLNMPKPIRATVSGNTVSFDEEDKKSVKRKLSRFVTDWTGNTARITKGHEYHIIDQILQSGHVPFMPKPVQRAHRIKTEGKIKLRTYQFAPWNNFLRFGAVGVFHPTGSGKSFVGMKALEKVRVDDRPNLIISPKITLLDQWREYIETHVPEVLENTVITTYQGFREYDKKFGVTIFDECRRLPATTFARLSTIQTEYRMGLDATPYREDGKNHLIVALTGRPQSINWPKYMRKYGPGYHAINVHIVKNGRARMAKVRDLYDARKRTMVYSYHLDIGRNAADMLGLEFINADTRNRLDVMRDNRSFVASSVFTEGLHIEDLDQIIEIDFHYGSRQEEMQLSGRLMHSKKRHKRHDIIMTLVEFDKYKKRLLSLEGNGFHVRLLED